jgi:hypothetical protein
MRRILAVVIVLAAMGACSQRGNSGAPPAGWAEAEKGLARVYIEGKTAEVVRISEQFVRDHPDFPDAHRELAGALETMARDMRRAGTTSPLVAQNFERAAAHYERYHALAGADQRASASRALMFLHDEEGLNDPGKAESFARRWKEEQPDQLQPHVYHADRLRKLGRHDEASAVMRSAREVERATLTGDEQMRASLRAAWAADVLKHLQESPNLPAADTREFVDELMKVSDEVLKASPTNFSALQARAAALSIRAERLESDPARKKALLAEAGELERRSRMP